MFENNLLRNSSHDEGEYLIEDKDFEKHLLAPSRIYHELKAHSIVKSCSFFLSILLCVLLFLNLVVFFNNSKCDPRETIYTKYHKDPRYMTLDHQYDHLWDELSSSNRGVIQFSAATNSSDADVAGLSM